MIASVMAALVLAAVKKLTAAIGLRVYIPIVFDSMVATWRRTERQLEEITLHFPNENRRHNWRKGDLRHRGD
ncbi:MAG: hypothetical protein U1F83_08975 [Verrucomicrobiota bacterium]